MSSNYIHIANRFLAGQFCSIGELNDFKLWLTDTDYQDEVEQWLHDNWTKADEIDSEVMIESVFRQIEAYESKQVQKSAPVMQRIIQFYQRIAAFLLIPVIGVGLLYWFGLVSKPQASFTETIAPRGQKSQIVLADGTKVWLNSDTKIKYPGNFATNQRDVYLEGEAFFEVTKNAHRPFVVHTSGMDVRVLGTKFDVKAYPDEKNIEASLFEGKINLETKGPADDKIIKTEVLPGQSFAYLTTEKKLVAGNFPKDEIDGWKKNQLIFKDDTFNNLVRKVERWYDVKIVYDEFLFNDRRLTVELREGERLDRLMQIISLALQVNYKYENGTILLTPKTMRM